METEKSIRVRNRCLLCMTALLTMAALSFTSLFGLSFAGASIAIGVIAFFANKIMSAQPSAGSGLDVATLSKVLRNASLWLWILLPTVMNFASILLAELILPEFVAHVQTRAASFVSTGMLPLMLAQLCVLALGEEIAWRAFFLRQAEAYIPYAPALIVSSALFALGHIAHGKPMIVAYDVLFVFVNSLLYGTVFKKTGNAWISAISHLIANLFVFAFLGWM